MLTMVDGKVCNALTKTSSAQCFTCEATNSTLNNLETIISRLTNKKALKYGFPVLHAWIRFMEFVLHVSYRLKLTKKLWQIQKKRNLSECEEHKIGNPKGIETIIGRYRRSTKTRIW
ncbi:hypothetical protein TKK_0007992 [Trichogramma kaykai]